MSVQTNFETPQYVIGESLDPDALIASLTLPLLPQITEYDQAGATTDGTYTLQADDGEVVVDASFVAASNTAAEIAAGLMAAWNVKGECRSVGTGAFTSGDEWYLTFREAGRAWTVSLTSDPSAGTAAIATVQAAGYSELDPTQIIQADGSGGYTATYTDAALALGVVTRNAELNHPLGLSSAGSPTGYRGASVLGLLLRGRMPVRIATGVTVLRGQKVYYNPTTKRYSNATTGSHVLVEGAQWTTSGTAIQVARFNLPSET